MLIVLSPAKSLNFDYSCDSEAVTLPDYLDISSELAELMRAKSPAQLTQLMGISTSLAELNHARFDKWHKSRHDMEHSHPAVKLFAGDVYRGLDAASFSSEDLQFAASHLRILSGLYGLLRPLDLIMPYRLEMGTGLQTRRGKGLYSFWRQRLTTDLATLMADNRCPALINLASAEYFKAVVPRRLGVPVISPVFRDFSKGRYRIIGFFAKKARGMMAGWVIRNRLTDPQDLVSFDCGGYRLSHEDSTDSSPVFVRKTAA